MKATATVRGDTSYNNGEKRVVTIWPRFDDNDDGRYALFVSPQSIERRLANRAQVMQTIGGLFIDSFGYGPTTGTVAGTFGWGLDAPREEGGQTGIERALELQRRYEFWQDKNASEDGQTDCELLVPMDGIAYLVYWGDLTLGRDASRPHLISYSLPFTVIFDRSNPGRKSYFPPLGVAVISGATPTVAPDEPPGTDPHEGEYVPADGPKDRDH